MMTHSIHSVNRRRDGIRRMAVAVALAMALGLGLGAPAQTRELMTPKEQSDTAIGENKSPSLDQQKRNVPQSIFTWIVMAKGYEVEWDSFGRKGWYTQDPRLKPVEPGTSVFPPDTPAVYIVFEVPPLEDPATFGAQWFLEDDKGKASSQPVGKDSLFVPWHEKQGFLELKKPAEGWKQGSYLVKIFVSPEGQQAFHAVNEVGTMRFQISDQPSPLPSGPPPAK
jgi:hypothetical protein